MKQTLRNKKLWIIAAIVGPLFAVGLDYHLCMLKVAKEVQCEVSQDEDGRYIHHNKVFEGFERQHPIGSRVPNMLPMKLRYRLFEFYIGMSVEDYMQAWTTICDGAECERCGALPDD